MTVVRYRPVLKDLWSTRRSIEDVFNSVFADEGAVKNAFPVDIVEKKDKFVIYGELPGIDESALKIQVQDNLLSIEATKPCADEQEGERYMIRELCGGTLARRFEIPHTVDQDKIDAVYTNGVLEVVLPKLPERQPKEISIKKQ